MTPSLSLAVSWMPADDAGLAQRARRLADELEVPLLDPARRRGPAKRGPASQTRRSSDDLRELLLHTDLEYILCYQNTGLALHQTGEGVPGPLQVSFAGGRDLWRLRHGGGRGQLIARAVGLHKSARQPTVLDATAGLGRDAYVLAGLGCQLTLLERSPIIAALLADGLSRLARSEDAELAELAERMVLHCVDAVEFLGASAAADVIYLDPMFPASGRAGGVRKEMQYFRNLLPSVDDEEQHGLLLEAALRVARHRVVVKRMKKSPVIPGIAPSYQMAGKSVRYDIYALRRYDR